MGFITGVAVMCIAFFAFVMRFAMRHDHENKALPGAPNNKRAPGVATMSQIDFDKLAEHSIEPRGASVGYVFKRCMGDGKDVAWYRGEYTECGIVYDQIKVVR